MPISPLLVISPYKATPGSVPKPAQNFLSYFVLIGLFLEDTGCVKSGHGCGRAVGVLLPFISSVRLSISSPFSSGEKKSQCKTGNDFLRISKTPCYV